MISRSRAVPTEKFRSTIGPMEARLSLHRGTEVKERFRLYTELAPRFERDFGATERDVAVAKAGALMLIQEYARSRNAL
jgi:hypothetical protein